MRNPKLMSVCCVLLFSQSMPVHAEWAGPLFGIATAPNGDILVADTGAGAVNYDRDQLVHFLPGITDIHPIGTSSLWATRTGLNPEEDTGQSLLRVSKGQSRMIANLFHFEETYNPHPARVESNPFDVHGLGGDAALVVDAAGNDLLRVSNQGDVHVLAIFPTRAASLDSLKEAVGCPAPFPACGLGDEFDAEPVPTSVVVGPDGYYYVGELRGFPGPVGESSIWRVAPWASWAQCGVSPDCTVAFNGGFTSIIDMAWGPDGLLYVAELDENGWLAAEFNLKAGGTVNACDIDSQVCVEVADGIDFLTAITFGKRGQLYATQDATTPPLATIIQIP